MENKTEILAERNGLKLVLIMINQKNKDFIIKLGTYIVLTTCDYTGYTNREKCVVIKYTHYHKRLRETPELAKETATKMAIVWFKSLFENNE